MFHFILLIERHSYAILHSGLVHEEFAQYYFTCQMFIARVSEGTLREKQIKACAYGLQTNWINDK